LTPVEREILDLLLKKQAGANAAAAEVQATCSGVKMENPAEGHRVAPSSAPVEEKAPSSAVQEKSSGSKWDDFLGDDKSDGPLDDEQMDRLMREFDFGGEGFDIWEEDEEEESSQEANVVSYKAPTSTRGRGRGRGRGGGDRGSKATRGGRGRGSRGQGPSWSDIDDDSLSDLGVDENDPVSVGLAYLEKLSDDQAMQYMESYKKEKKPAAGTELESNDFFTWLANEMRSQSLASPPIMTQGKKVVFHDVQDVFQDSGKRGGGRGRGRGGGRGSRGGRKGGSRGKKEEDLDAL